MKAGEGTTWPGSWAASVDALPCQIRNLYMGELVSLSAGGSGGVGGVLPQLRTGWEQMLRQVLVVLGPFSLGLLQRPWGAQF